jgi:hypothetical protein
MSEERIPTGTRYFDLSTNRNNLNTLDQGNKSSIVTEAAKYIVGMDVAFPLGNGENTTERFLVLC